MSLQRLINEVRELMDSVEPPELDGDETEEAARTVKRRVAGGMGTRTGKQCPKGQHMVGGSCQTVPSAQLRKLAKAKARWRKSAGGKKSAAKSAKLRRRRGA